MLTRNVLEIDFIAILMWGIVVFGVMLAVAVTYNIVKKMIFYQPPKQPPPSSLKEYFVTIDVGDSILSYNQAKSNFDNMDYKSAIANCHIAVKALLSKILDYLHIPFPQDLNIVDMSFLALSRGVKVSFVEPTQHMNSIRLRSILDQPISRDEVLWMLSACKTMIDTCKELPITLYT
ncbi:MAG: hypothetical protein ACUVQ8_00095 [Nitrososphaeria archaeon]